MKQAVPEIVLEVPIPWFTNPHDGMLHRDFYASLLSALAKAYLTIHLRPLEFGADLTPRSSQSNKLTISYHSSGNNTEVIRIKESYIPGYYSIDRLGYSGFSELAKNPDKFEKLIINFDKIKAKKINRKIRKLFIEKNISKYKQPSKTNEKLPTPFVFMPLQTLNDPVSDLSNFDQMEALDICAKWCLSKEINLIVKQHPLCNSRYILDYIQSMETKYDNLKLSSLSVHEIIQSSHIIFGCNSGVLFESLIHEKPVVSFGKSDFMSATCYIETTDQISESLENAYKCVDMDYNSKFTGWYLEEYCFQAHEIDRIYSRIELFLKENGYKMPKVPKEQKSIDKGAKKGKKIRDQKNKKKLNIFTKFLKNIKNRDNV